MATIDALSQLYSRMHFMELAEKEFARAARYHTSFSLLMMDIDKFKSVNDSQGHAAGDAVIDALGKMMRHRFRKTDLLGRLGGEEFAVLLPNTSIGEAKKLAEDFRSKVSKNKVHYGDALIRITISIGTSAFAKKSESFEEILQYADEALYQSKAGGRNRVLVKEPQAGVR